MERRLPLTNPRSQSRGQGTPHSRSRFTMWEVHHYAVSQVAGSADGWSYDVQTYEVTVYCYSMGSQSSGALKTLVVIDDGDGYKAEACTFSNSYETAAEGADASSPGAGSSGEVASGSGVTGGDDASASAAIGNLLTPFTGDSDDSKTAIIVLVLGVVAIAIGVVIRRRRDKK
jgi:pilin isopeptide linkage protein